MATLTIAYSEITEKDYDDIDETIKVCTPSIDGTELPHKFNRASAETDADSETAIRTALTDKGYTFDA